MTQIVLRSSWLLDQDSEGDDRSGARVRIGDHVSLARYLDYRLKPLKANGRLALPPIRIGAFAAAATIITTNARITAIQIDFNAV